ncbi:MAG: hypothetical protein KTR31_40260 [Myxococcales bacterium]|nr:hypothetical protein [Myxococcales bacterium]
MEQAHAEFVEQVALHWEQYGLPRIGGRILGWLLVCDPPHRSASQLAQELSVSKGSVSSMTRLLLSSGSLEVVPVAGGRGTFYRVTHDGFGQRFERKLAMMVGFRSLLERALQLAPATRRDDLEELTAMYRFLERELPLLFERWRDERHA